MAKLIANKKYAVIQNEKVHSLLMGSELPEYNEKQIFIVEATEDFVVGDQYINKKHFPNSDSRETLEKVRTEKINELKTQRNEETISGLMNFKGHKFQISQETFNHISSAASFAALLQEVPKDFFWISEDNKKVPMTFEEFKSFTRLYMEHSQNIIKKYEELRTKVVSAKTISAVKSIKW